MQFSVWKYIQDRHASQNWNGMYCEQKYVLPDLLKTTPLPTCFGQPNTLAKSWRRSIDGHQQYGCLTLTHPELQVTLIRPSFWCFFLVAPLRSQPHSAGDFAALGTGWSQVPRLSRSCGMKINLHPMTIVTVCFVFYVLFSVSKCPKVSDLKLIWNSLCMETEVTKEIHQITATDE